MTFRSRPAAGAAVLLLCLAAVLPCSAKDRSNKARPSRHPAKKQNAGDSCSMGKFAPLTKVDMHKHIKSVAPLDPPAGAGNALHLDGVTTLHVAFGPGGRVQCVKVVRGESAAAEAIAKSVKDWKFSPYKEKGKFRAAAGDLTIKYHLRDQGSTAAVE
jgi:hypothetical protein